MLPATRIWPNALFAAFTTFGTDVLVASGVLGIDAVFIGGYGLITEVLYIADGTRIGYWDGITFRTMTGLLGTIKAIWMDQGYIWVGTTTHLMYAAVDGAATALLTHTAGNVDMIAGGHGKVVLGNANVLAEVVLPATRTTVDTLRGNYGFLCGCSGPGQLYVSGYGTGHQTIFRTTLDPATTALGKLIEACRLPDGEIVTALHTYGNQVVVIGTSLGCRLALINDDGSLTFGPLFGPPCSGSMASHGRYVYYPGTFYGEGGTAKLDLTNFVADLVPAWAPDLTDPAITAPRGVAIFESMPAVANGSGKLYVPDPATKRPTGYMDSGWINYGVPITKTWMDATVTHGPLAGTVEVAFLVEDGAEQSVGTSAAPGSTSPVDAFYLGDERTDTLRLILRFNRDAVATSTGPILRSWTVHAVPAPTRHDEILLSVIFKATSTTPREGEQLAIDTLDEYTFLSEIAASGRTVTYQEGRNTQRVQILGLELHPTKFDYANGQTLWLEGELLIRMQTV